MSRLNYSRLFQDSYPDESTFLHSSNHLNLSETLQALHSTHNSNSSISNSIISDQNILSDPPSNINDESTDSLAGMTENDIISRLVPISAVPPSFRQLFPFSSFNYVQSTVFDSIYKTDENIVVEAPTGSGKTVILELAILRVLENTNLFAQTSDRAAPISDKVIVYIAPTKV